MFKIFEKLMVARNPSHQEDYGQQEREKEKERKLGVGQSKKDDPKKKAQIEAVAVTQRMLQAAKTLERMVNQNIFDEISQGIFLKRYDVQN